MRSHEDPIPLEELVASYLEERESGRTVDVEAFVQRHPAQADELREVLAGMALLEEAGEEPFVAGESDAGRRAVTRVLKMRECLAAGASLTELEKTPRSSGGSEFVAQVLAQVESAGAPVERYVRAGEIARGGQGAVLAVWDETLRRHLAMKVALTSTEDRDTPTPTRTIGRFLEEAQVTAQLDHPGIVPVHDLGLDTERHVFFTMKLVKGRDFRAVFDLVREGEEGWTQTRALNVLLKVCEAMAYAHSKGAIHRDLKPSNVMVGKYGEVYVMDWGLARVRGREDRKDVRIQPQPTEEIRSPRHESADDLDSPLVTMDGDVVGTPAYMSPEQAKGELEAMGPHSDVYAVGAMLYQLLTSEMPYVPTGSRLSNRAVWALVQKGPPDPVHTRARDVPVELQAICEKAMARDVAARYGDMQELAADLHAFLENRVVAAHRTGAVVELRKWVQRNRGLAAAIAAAIVVAIGGLSGVGYVQAEGKKLADVERTNVMRLSALQDLEDLKREADELWPPWPRHEEAYEEWLRRARELVAGLEPSPDGSDIGHLARLAELEARALPLAEEQREEDRRSHPRYAEREQLEQRLSVLRAAQAVRKGSTEVTEVELSEALQSRETFELAALAWECVGPNRGAFGEEAHGLAVARLAVSRESATPYERAFAWMALGWGMVANGVDEEAVEAAELAVEESPAENLEMFRSLQSDLLAEVEAGWSGARIAGLETELAQLESELSQRSTWRFERDEDRWWRQQLAALIAGIEALADPETGLIDGRLSEEHGWGVARRLEWARTVDERTLTDPEPARGWARAITSIADREVCPVYNGLTIGPQLGLVPLGRDPDSGLWEFGHPLSGTVPKRGDAGKLVLEESCGLVFVLIPGGSYRVGAQNADPTKPHFDAQAQSWEGPVHEVALSPFFLSKYEMTQGQWLRIAGANPSQDGAGGRGDANLLHPVEQVSWLDCERTLRRLGLRLPTEAEWECGARGGTSSVWSTGDDKRDLVHAANLADRFAAESQSALSGYEDWNDGHSIHASVGSYRANPFGLHDVHGNVWEWCQDLFDRRFYVFGPRVDPCNDDGRPDGGRIIRGSSYFHGSVDARSANRRYFTPETILNNVGMRPAREVMGEIRYAK